MADAFTSYYQEWNGMEHVRGTQPTVAAKCWPVASRSLCSFAAAMFDCVDDVEHRSLRCVETRTFCLRTNEHDDRQAAESNEKRTKIRCTVGILRKAEDNQRFR